MEVVDSVVEATAPVEVEETAMAVDSKKDFNLFKDRLYKAMFTEHGFFYIYY